MLDQVINVSDLVIERPIGSAHPNYPSMIYPCNYGYLKDTTGGDGNEIDIWVGSNAQNELNGIICTVDKLKKDCEIKLLIGCCEDEIKKILDFHNSSEFISGILVRRDS